MFFNKSLLAVISAVAFIGNTAAQFTGTASLGFDGTTNCGCPASNGPSAISIPAADVGAHVCCDESITVTYNGKSVSGVFNGIFTDAPAGTDDIQLSSFTFEQIEDDSSETSLSPVTWSFT
ncbi:hypothetical protein K438DRAFT_1784073 [Mycena galopus ATCC 62051]|nr:hypothetical protein K438DRAFT_1787326 [Mycena galopus ATCC 62051]KAF8143133.1 hypothetical protein K438DRAFT_1784073 [Mycena galopus ATCC 62051]